MKKFVFISICLLSFKIILPAAENLIPNPEFLEEAKGWHFTTPTAVIERKIVEKGGPDGSNAFQITITKPAENKPGEKVKKFLFQCYPVLKKDISYTLRAQLKSDIGVDCRPKVLYSKEPWPEVFPSKVIKLPKDQWTPVSLDFKPNQDDKVILMFSFISPTGSIMISGVQLTETGSTGPVTSSIKPDATDKTEPKPQQTGYQLPKDLGTLGKIVTLDPAKLAITVLSERTKRDESYILRPDAKIFLDGQPSKIDAIKTGMMAVTVSDVDPIYATALHAKSP
jgi:hypothetical protein